MHCILMHLDIICKQNEHVLTNIRVISILLPMQVTEGWATIEDVLPLRRHDDLCDAR